jgi:hypothetical protein
VSYFEHQLEPQEPSLEEECKYWQRMAKERLEIAHSLKERLCQVLDQLEVAESWGENGIEAMDEDTSNKYAQVKQEAEEELKRIIP